MVPEIWSATDIIFCHLGLFLAFSLPKNLENLNFEKMKKTPGDIIILHKYIKDHDHMLYHSWDMALDRYNFYFSFWAIFYPFIPQQPKRSKLKKKKKKKKNNAWRYHYFTYMYQKLWLNDVQFLRYGARRTDGQKKWQIDMGTPPKKFSDSVSNEVVKKTVQQIIYKSKQFREKIPDKTTWICINQDNTVNKVWRKKMEMLTKNIRC